MLYAVEFLPSAVRVLHKLAPDIQKRLVSSIEHLGVDPRPRGCKKLHGKPDLYRIRVGDYRVIYKVDDGVLRVLVVALGHRGGIYG